MKSLAKALEHIAEHIKVHEGGAVLIHYWGVEAEDEHNMKAFERVLAKRTARDVKAVFIHAQKIAADMRDGGWDEKRLYGDFEPEMAMTTIDLCCYSPPSLMAAMDDAAKPQFVQFMRKLFGLATAEGKIFAQLRLPSQSNAEESGMPYEVYVEKWMALVNVDYCDIKQRCAQVIKSIQHKKDFTVVTGGVHRLTFSVAERTWYADDGNGDFPAGEVYIAPVEDSVGGSFLAEKVFWEGTLYKDVVLTFEAGVLVASTPACILEDLCHAPGDALRFAEFGIGQNKALNALTGNSLFDEKMHGTCHVAVGANFMFGGENQGPVHIDFVAAAFEISPV